MDLGEKRRRVAPLLGSMDPADALAGYYALWHDARRTQLHVHYDLDRRADGFLVVAQTGADLFRPLVTLRGPDSAVGLLLQAGLAPRRPYRIVAPARYSLALSSYLLLQHVTFHRIYRLDPARFQPVINVLVQRTAGADGTPRFQIESQGQLMAMSGTNWRSPAWAEVFVYVHPAARGRGWGRSVVSACAGLLLEERLHPLYMVEEDNEASIHIAEALGFADTGAREIEAEGQLREP